MVSTTATALASNRRKLRLAASATAPTRDDGRNAAVVTASENHPQRSREGISTPFLQHQQLEHQKEQLQRQKDKLLRQHNSQLHLQQQQDEQQQQHQQQLMQAPDSAGRGRPRRSRVGNRRVVGLPGRGDGRGGMGIGSSSNNGRFNIDAEQEDARSSMSFSVIGGGGGGDNPMSGGKGGAHLMLDAHRHHHHHIHRAAHHNIGEHGHGEEPHPSSSSSSPKLALNLHVAHSVDSDDNGTCFNSIGTTTPRQPSPRHISVRHHATNVGSGESDSGQMYQPDFHDGDSSNVVQQRLLPFNTNNHQTMGPLHENSNASTSDPSSSFVPTNGKPHRQQDEFRSMDLLSEGGPKTHNISIWDHPEEMISKSINSGSRYKPSDYEPAYSEFGDGASCPHGGAGRRGGGGWGSYNAQNSMRGGRSVHREGASVASNSQAEQENKRSTVNALRSVRKDQRHNGLGSDKSMARRIASISPTSCDGDSRDQKGIKDATADITLLNRSNMKAAFGVCTAATIGAVILGPVGLLVGAASVAIGMGVMQIPEEQRNNVRNHAATSIERARVLVWDVSDSMSSSCAKFSSGSDPAEIVGKVIPEDIMEHCSCFNFPSSSKNFDYRGERSHRKNDGDGIMGGVGDDGLSMEGVDEIRSVGSSPVAHARLVGDVFRDDMQHSTSPLSLSMNLVGGGGVISGVGDNKGRGTGGGGEGYGLGALENENVGRRVACGRKGRIVPLSQIHSLRPSLQPRAWLDVMANAHTTRDDKNEAMEEILILAKDKEISRWFLEEGILDSLMFILSNYFRNYSSYLRNETPIKMTETEKEEPFTSFKSGNAFCHAKLAANCCVALGKAHCAAVHTEGDLLLMSAYSRGSVPIERQLAQMLFEVPHHMKVMIPAGVNSANENQQLFDGEFTLTELSMQQAEDLASSIKALDDGKNILAT